MSRNIHHPTPERRISQNRFATKRVRQRPLAYRWWVPGCTAGDEGCTGDEPALVNGFAQPSIASGLEPFGFRLHTDGSLQFKGHLNVSAASSGTIALTLPGADPGEIDFLNLDVGSSQSYLVMVTTTGTLAGVYMARAHVDPTTGEVTVSWREPGTIPTIRIYGTCTLPWSFNNTASFYTFANLDVANGGLLNAKFHNLAVASVTSRISVSDDAAGYMDITTIFGNPAGVGMYGSWCVEILETGVYAVRYQGHVGGPRLTNINFSSNIELPVLQTTPLQNRNQHRPWAWQGGGVSGGTNDVAAEDIVVIDEDDLAGATPGLNMIAARVVPSAAIATDRSFGGELVVHRLGDISDFPRFTYSYDHP